MGTHKNICPDHGRKFRPNTLFVSRFSLTAHRGIHSFCVSYRVLICKPSRVRYPNSKNLERLFSAHRVTRLSNERPLVTMTTNDHKKEMLWDSTNIIESYPGITLP